MSFKRSSAPGMNSKTPSVLDQIASKVAREHKLNFKEVRSCILAALKGNPENEGENQLPSLFVTLPDGSKMAVIPDLHMPASYPSTIEGTGKSRTDIQSHTIEVNVDSTDVFGLSKWTDIPRQ